MVEKFEFDDSLLDNAGLGDDVTEVEGDIENLEQVEEQIEETQETEQQPEVTDTVAEEVTKQEELNIEELSDEDLNNALENSNKGDLNIALHKARDKGKQYKYENELRQQEIELLRQQLELLKTTNTPTNTPTPTVKEEVDILSDIEDSDVITKADMKKVLELQKQQLLNEQQAVQKQTSAEKSLQLAKKFNISHGQELGELSYENIYKKFDNGEVKLTKGQVLDIENAVQDGINPAELLYNYVINNDSTLKSKNMQREIKNLINSKKNVKANKTEEPVLNTKDKLDLGLALNRKNSSDKDSHFDSLVDSIDF